MIGIRRVDKADRRAVKMFARVGRAVHAGDAQYVPPTDSDIVKRFTGRSAIHRHVDAGLFLATDGGREVGRLAAMVNSPYQGHHREAVGFLGYLAAKDGPTLDALVAAGEEWLAGRGVTRVVAGYDGSFLIGFSIRTDEFEETPIFPFPWQPPYYAGTLERLGYQPTYPWWFYRTDFASPAYQAASSRALAPGHAKCTVREIDKKNWKKELELFAKIMDEGFRDEWEYHPVGADQLLEVFGPFKAIVEPWQLLFAMVDGKAVAVTLGVRDYSALLKAAKGSMGPRAIARLMFGAKKIREGGLLVIATLPEFRGRHIGQTLTAHLYRSFERVGMSSAWYYAVNDANRGSRALAESMGGEGRVLAHNYDRRIEA